MNASLPLLCAALCLCSDRLETRFMQAHPAVSTGIALRRSADRQRAVVLIHGFRAHPFSESEVAKPGFHDWQRPGSFLVRQLAKDSDVFSFSYGQNLAVD